jgi:hypothetical protein
MRYIVARTSARHYHAVMESPEHHLTLLLRALQDMCVQHGQHNTAQALDRLGTVLAQAGATAPQAASGIGELGLKLLRQIGRQAPLRETAQQAAIRLALWVASCGGELETLEQVTDALAQQANGTEDPLRLAEMSLTLETLLCAAGPLLRADRENDHPGRPWRVLHFNRAICATRSHDPELMARAFDGLRAHLPGEAPGFFAEGLREMERLNYPPHVRRVMQRYHDLTRTARALH